MIILQIVNQHIEQQDINIRNDLEINIKYPFDQDCKPTFKQWKEMQNEKKRTFLSKLTKGR